MSCLRFMTENYLDVDLLAASFVSSEDPNFPVSNLYNKNRRSLVWRSQGYFLVVDGENTIVFNEGGSDLTAEVVPGEYDSVTTFMAAIDSAFTSATGATGSYTVSQTATLKFQITKSAGTFTIKWTHVNSADMAAILGFSTTSDDTGALSYTADLLRINSEEWILWDLGTSANPDSIIMIGPRNRPIKLTPSGQFRIQGSETNNFTTPSYNQVLDYDDEVIMKVLDGGLHTEALRYWRVQFLDQNALGYLELGSIFLGESFLFDRGRAQFPFVSNYIDRTNTIFSEGGQSFSEIVQQSQSFTVNWDFLSAQDIEDFTEVFRKYGVGAPFFMVFDNESKFSSSPERLTKFVKFIDPPRWDLITPNRFVMSASFREEL